MMATPQNRVRYIEDKIYRIMEEDEKFQDMYEGLRSTGNGTYNYDQRRFIKRTSIRVPQQIREQFDNIKEVSYMGLFPKINRAWITFDNKLFLWDYGNNRTYKLEPLPSPIVSVGLARPKKNVFAKEVKFVLVVATKHEVILYGLLFDGGVNGELEAKRSRYSISCDNKKFLKIVGIKDGRIFLCGDDGNVYEFEYEVYQPWFGSEPQRKCRKVNKTLSIWQTMAHLAIPTTVMSSTKSEMIIDMVVRETPGGDTWFYTLSKKSSIRAYRSARGVEDIQWKHEVTDTIRKAQINSGDASFCNDSLRVVKLATISNDSSRAVQLIAITNKGDRIFFNQYLKVVFVRLRCPQLSPSVGLGGRVSMQPLCTLNSPTDVQITSLYNNGVTILTDNRTLTHDTLVIFSRSPHPTGQLAELVESETVEEDRVQAVAEVPRENFGNFTAWLLYARHERLKRELARPLVGLSEFATQHAFERGRRFLVLCRYKIDTYEYLRPVGELARTLKEKSNAARMQGLTTFQRTYGTEETLVMCLILAFENRASHSQGKRGHISSRRGRSKNALVSGQSGSSIPTGSYSNGVQDSTERQMHETGNGSLKRRRGLINRGSTSSVFHTTQRACPKIETRAIETFFHQSLNDARRPCFAVPGGQELALLLSCRMEAVMRFLARHLRAVWEVPITKDSNPAFGPPSKIPRWDKVLLTKLKEPICFLEEFVMRHRNNLGTKQVRDLNRQRPIEEEHVVLTQLMHLLRKCVEGFNVLLSMANPNSFRDVYSKLALAEQKQLAVLTLHELVTKDMGLHLARSFIKTKIETQINQDNKWVDELNQNCPHFFNNSHLLTFQANLKLHQVSYVCQNEQKNNMLIEEALSRYKRACEDQTFDLERACYELCKAGSFYGAVDLALHKAQQVPNKTNKVNEYHDPNQNSPEEERCWLEVWKVLKILGVGPPDFIVTRPLEMDEPTKAASLNRVLTRLLQSNSRRFLYRLFNWFFKDANKLEMMFEFPQSRTILLWLTSTDNFDTVAADKKRIRMVNKYFSVTKQPRDQLQFLDKVLGAQGPEVPLDLDDRIHLLMEARSAAESLSLNPNSNREDLYDRKQTYTDRIQVARIQQKILDEIRKLTNVNYDMKILSDLKSKIFDVDALYTFSSSNRLWTCALECLNHANAKNETALVDRLWMCIISNEIKLAGFGEGMTCEKRPWAPAVANRLILIASKYINTPQQWVFPIQTVVAHLEKSALMYIVPGQDDIQVVDMMRKLGVSDRDLLVAYNGIVSRQAGNAKTDFQQRILQSVTKLLAIVRENRKLEKDSMETMEQADLVEAGYNLCLSCRLLANRVVAKEPGIAKEYQKQFEEFEKDFES